jgi:hypothetical protein
MAQKKFISMSAFGGTSMRFVFVLLLSAFQFSVAFAQPNEGKATLSTSYHPDYNNFLYLEGEVATAIYQRLNVEEIAVGEMLQDRLKIGENIQCLAMYSTVVCSFQFSDMDRGKIKQYDSKPRK